MSHMGRRWRNGVRAVGLAVIVAVGASACGSASPSAHRGPAGTPRQIVLASATRTAGASTAHVKLTISISGTPSFAGLTSVPSSTDGTSGPVSLSINAVGDFDFVNKSGSLTLDAPSATGASSQAVQVRVIGPTLYVSAPGLAVADDGKTWVRVDLAQYLQKQGESGGALGDFSTGDPTQILGLLQQASGDVTVVGPAIVDGVRTTRYHATIDLTKQPATGSSLLGPDQVRQFQRAIGLGALPVDVWVDGEGRACQLQMKFAFFGLTISVTLHLGGFGAPVSVAVPPADQTADGSGLLRSGRLGSLLGGTSASPSSSSSSATGP